MNARAFIPSVFAAASDIVGEVKSPLPPAYQNVVGANGGLILLISNILRLLFVGAGIFAFFNIVIAGFGFMNAGGDAKQITAAWDRIWQSLVGLVLIVGSFAAAALFGYVIFGDAGFILNPKIYGPGQ
jgi:hypothetical protein